MADLDLSDSYARLAWMKHLGAQTAKLADTTMRGLVGQGLAHDEKVFEGRRYVRLWLKHSVPADLGFLLADFAVNGRSCLDMAMGALVRAHGLTWARPEFPLVDDVNAAPTTPLSWKLAHRVLPSAHLEAVKGMQPRAFRYGGDVPVNITGVELRTLANENKHRNLTPVVARDVMRSIRGRGKVRLVRGMPWPEAADSLIVLRAPEAMTAEQMIDIAKPTAELELQVSGMELGYVVPGVTYDGKPFRFPIKLDNFLDRAPKFVALALSTLEQADEWHRGGEVGPLFLDKNGFL